MNKKELFIVFIISIILFVSACNDPKSKDSSSVQPNILWILLEDTAPLLSCYGETLINTPHIDDLAKNGVLFENAIMPSPVCSPSRSSMITGVMSTSFGAHNHHSSRTPESSIYLPDHMQTLPEIFKEAGYFTFNNGKDDYNFSYNRKDLYTQSYRTHPLYGMSGVPIELSSLSNQTPFFGQIQLRGGKEIYNSKFGELVTSPVDRSKITLPPYLPNHPDLVEEYANHLDAIQVTDVRVGEIIEQLKENGLLKNTIVFFFSDHGMRITRNKQFLYEGGLHVPLIIADFTESNKIIKGSKESALVSGLDLAPSSLDLAGISIPEFMEGHSIFDEEAHDREFVISTRDRCDFTIDRIRSVRTKDYKYIRNFMVDRPATQTTYMDVNKVSFVLTMHQLNNDEILNADQQAFFTTNRPKEELYNLKDDPNELNNLADHPDYIEVRKEHANILEDWMNKTDDRGQYAEDEENLKLMLGIWGDYAGNPEYDELRKKYPDLSGSQFSLKNSKWQVVN